MKKIFIDELKIYGYHGCLAEEKQLGQFFLISVEMRLQPSKAEIQIGGAGAQINEPNTQVGSFTQGNSFTEGDHLSTTVNYGEVCSQVERIVKNTRYDLIESLGEDIARAILLTYAVLGSVSVTVKKPNAPVPVSYKMISVTVERAWHTVYLGLGSNLGDREKNIRGAIDLVSGTPGCKVINSSKTIETKPWGNSDQPDFLNSVLVARTFLEPGELLSLLKVIERQMGRVPDIKWGPRIIDIDILLYDMAIINTEELQIPHPYMHERKFVLEPLAEIAPNAIHPVKGMYIREFTL